MKPRTKGVDRERSGDEPPERGSDRTRCLPPGAGVPAQQWATLVAHRDNLVSLAHRYGAGADAEDVAQEALLRAATRTGLDPTRVKSYLAKVAANLAIDLRRRAASERLLRTHACFRADARAADDVEAVEERLLARHAAQLVAGLDDGLRDIVHRRTEGADWRQIAAEVGEAKTTVQMRFYRAMALIRRQLNSS